MSKAICIFICQTDNQIVEKKCQSNFLIYILFRVAYSAETFTAYSFLSALPCSCLPHNLCLLYMKDVEVIRP